jgi:hypothetical protein
MISTQSVPAVDSRHRFAPPTAAILLIASVGVALTLMILALTSTSGSVTRSHQASPYFPLIQYRGTGAPPPARVNQTVIARQANRASVRSEHSYGAVP